MSRQDSEWSLSDSAMRLSERIRHGEVSSYDVVAVHLERIRRLNSALNAVVTLDAHVALERARAADAASARGEDWGEFHGVPVTVKDALATRGMRTTCGLKLLREYVPKADATAVARLRAAGAVILGKTNVPTLTGDYQTDNALFGRSNNPWDLDRTPGGSSGGGAAAVAARLSFLEVGSDLGGSIRLPAHYCGVFGFKPTGRRIPMTGHIPPLPGEPRGLRNLASIGILGRSVRDLRAALRAIAGPDRTDWTVPPVPLRTGRGRGRGPVRIAWTDRFPGIPLAEELRATIVGFVRRLGDDGVFSARATPANFDPLEAAELFGAIFAAEVNSTSSAETEGRERAALRAAGAAQSSDPYTRGYAKGLELDVRGYARLLRRRDALIRALEAFFRDWDGWICPVAPTAAVRHRTRGTPIRVDARTYPYLAQGWYCLPFNLTDHPAVVIPQGTTAEGLPISVQVVGALWKDTRLLDVAERLAAVSGAALIPPFATDGPGPATLAPLAGRTAGIVGSGSDDST